MFINTFFRLSEKKSIEREKVFYLSWQLERFEQMDYQQNTQDNFGLNKNVIKFRGVLKFSIFWKTKVIQTKYIAIFRVPLIKVQTIK